MYINEFLKETITLIESDDLPAAQWRNLEELVNTYVRIKTMLLLQSVVAVNRVRT